MYLLTLLHLFVCQHVATKQISLKLDAREL
jgi:hypothetical protein